MPELFDKDHWETHWQDSEASTRQRDLDPNPYLVQHVAGLAPGTALDAGSGEGIEAAYLAERGWQVTAVDISAAALALARERFGDSIEWIEADLGTWEPGRSFDLVATHYAHPPTSQLDFYEHISHWVRPGGTLLIVGHLHTGDHGHHGHHDHGDIEHPPEQSTVTAAAVTDLFDATEWEITSAIETTRLFVGRDGHEREMHDVAVSATRRS